MRRIVLGCLGASAGFLLGWPLAGCWAALTGNLVMRAEAYEERRGYIELVLWLIVGVSSVLGGSIAISLVGGRRAVGEKDQARAGQPVARQ
jgi:biotin transporter BioY